MNLLGIHLGVLIGKTVPIPPSISVTEALEKVEVTHKAKGVSGFQLVFHVGRGGPADLLDHSVLQKVKKGMRVILTVAFNAIPRVLSDGIITHIQIIPGNRPGETRLCATGEDVTYAMTLEEKEVEHPAQPESVIVAKIILKYAKYGLIPKILPAPLIDPPIPTERTPVQRSTDLAYINQLSKRFGYEFHVTAGPIPGVNQAYWGPPIRIGKPQPALSVNMGPATNVKDIKFLDDSGKAVKITGSVQDRFTNKALPVQSLASTRLPLSISRPTLLDTRTVLPPPFSGLSAPQALTRALGMMDASFDDVVCVEGELDTLRYNGILKPRALIGVRGGGFRFNGFYYVKQVTHCIERGNYQQSFKLSREGLGSFLPILPV